MSGDREVAAAEGLFAQTSDGPRLLGSRCQSCGQPSFPRADSCRNPACGQGPMEDAPLGPEGTLWSWALQNYPPPAPARYPTPYVPYAIGVVDLDDGLRVVGRMSVEDPGALEIGAKVELVLEPIDRDEQGRDVLTWKFRPR